jgi:hypothetical protein
LVESDKINLELTIREADIIRRAIASNSPLKEDEMISFMIYSRITRAIENAIGKNEPL